MSETFEDDAVTRVHRHYKEARQHSSEWRDKARESYDFEAGNQWSEEDRSRLNDADRPAVTIDRISRTLNAIIGTQINNRQETRYIPREMGDVQVNEILTAAGEWVRDECDAEDEESDAFNDVLVCGMGWTQTNLNYEEDPDGMVTIERRDPLWMFWDPSARKKNLSDRRWQVYIRTYSRDEFQANWPDADIEAAAAPWDDVIEEEEGGLRTHVYPQDAYKENHPASGRDRKTIRVGFEEYWKYETFYRAGPGLELDSEQYDRLKDKLAERGIRVVKQRRKKFYRTIVAGSEKLEDGPALDERGFSFHCMTGKRDRNRNIWFGIVEVMKDPQRWGNKFFSQILDIINKNSKGGVIAEKNAVDDQRKFEEEWARPDAVHWVRDGAMVNGKIVPKQMGQYPSGLDKLMGFSLDSVHEVTGVNLETLGLANRDQPNILEQTRKQAGLTILAVFFDALRRYRKEQGRTMLTLIQRYISDGRLIRIMGQNGDPAYIPLLREQQAARYDVIVDEAPTSPNQKERVFGILQAMMPSLAKMGIAPPKEILDYTPLPHAVSQKWKEQIEQGSQIPPEIQKQLEQLSSENAKLKDKKAETFAGLEIKQSEAQVKAQASMQELERKRMEMEADLQMERAKIEEQLTLKREETAAEIELKRIELAADIEIERQKMQIEREKVTADRDAKAGAMHKALSDVQIKMPKRKISVNRTADGFIDTIDINDEVAGSA